MSREINFQDTLEIKKNKKLYYYNFIEAFEVSSKKSKDAIAKALLIRDAFRNNNLKSTITPHICHKNQFLLQGMKF